MTVINSAPSDDNGRVFYDVGFPAIASAYGGFHYTAAGALACDSTNGAATSFVAGFSYLGKYLRIFDVEATTPTPAAYNQGLPMDASGNLLCTSTEPVASWVHGWPVSAAGYVCIGTATPVIRGAFTDGFDGGYG